MIMNNLAYEEIVKYLICRDMGYNKIIAKIMIKRFYRLNENFYHQSLYSNWILSSIWTIYASNSKWLLIQLFKYDHEDQIDL